jgi:hypothetical protein
LRRPSKKRKNDHAFEWGWALLGEEEHATEEEHDEDEDQLLLLAY